MIRNGGSIRLIGSGVAITPEKTIPFLIRDLARSTRLTRVPPGPLYAASGSMKLIPEVEKYLSTELATPRQLSVLSWSLNKLAIYDSRIWDTIAHHFCEMDAASPSDTAIILFSLSNVLKSDKSLLNPPSLASIESRIKHLASDSSFVSSVSLCDSAQICYAVSSMFPKSSSVISFIKQAIAHLESIPVSTDSEELPILNSCRDVCLLWSVARNRNEYRNRLTNDLISTLLESSRGLRNCKDFNQNKVGQLCVSLAILNVNDPRPVYQVILFVDSHHKEINGKNLIRIIRAMGNLLVGNDVLWKRIANRLEDEIALRYTIPQLSEIRHTFAKLAPSNQRILGLLDLYIKTKSEQTQYGPI